MQFSSYEKERPQSGLAIDWYVAYVKHQHEKKAADLLRRKGLEVFLPQQKVIHRWKDRNKTLLLPLFPGYVFLHCSMQDKLRILSTPGVFFLVENGGRACVIAREEIDSIRRVAESGLQVQSHPYISAGDCVRVCSGPLSGFVGILTSFRNRHRVVLTVEQLKKSVSFEVELGNVERIGGKRAHDSGAAA